jgi:hypothetical protein
MFSDNLSTLTAESDDIHSYVKNQRQLILSRPYKGLMLDGEQIILDFQRDTIVARVSRLENLWDYYGQTIYIHNPNSLKAFTARLVEFNAPNGMAYLSDLKLLNHDWSKRCPERVQPESPVTICIVFKRIKLQARVEDISSNGMGIWASDVLSGYCQSKGSLSLRCILHEPFFNEKTNLPGSIIYMQQCQKGTVKAGIRLFLGARRTRQLEQYIAFRKKEILEELSQTLFDFQQPRETKSLFF